MAVHFDPARRNTLRSPEPAGDPHRDKSSYSQSDRNNAQQLVEQRAALRAIEASGRQDQTADDDDPRPGQRPKPNPPVRAELPRPDRRQYVGQILRRHRIPGNIRRGRPGVWINQREIHVDVVEWQRLRGPRHGLVARRTNARGPMSVRSYPRGRAADLW